MNEINDPIDYILQFNEIKHELLESGKKIANLCKTNNINEVWKEQVLFNESVTKLLSAYEYMIASKEVKSEK